MGKKTNLLRGSILEEKLLWLYLAFIPIMNAPFITFAKKKILYADFMFAILLIVWIVKCLNGKTKVEKSSLEFPLFLMLFLFSVSFINSVDFLYSFAELAGLIYLIILFILLINVISNLERLRRLLYVYLFISTVISLIGLTAFCYAMATDSIIGNPFFQYKTIESMVHHFPRLQLTFGTPNMLLTYLHTALIFSAILFLLESRRHFRKIIFACITVIVLAALLTGSRRFTGLFLSGFIILLIFGRGRAALLLKWTCLIGFCVFLIASLITSIWTVFPVNIAKDETAKTFSLEINYAYSLHFIQPITAINMIKKHPIIGVGVGTYNKHFKENVDWEWLRSSFSFKAYPEYVEPVENKTLNFDPHSVYLGTLAETGIVGFVGLIYFLLKYMSLLIKRFKQANNFTFEKILSGCILAGFIGFLLNGLTIDMLSMRHFWFMIAIGLVCNNLYIYQKNQ